MLISLSCSCCLRCEMWWPKGGEGAARGTKRLEDFTSLIAPEEEEVAKLLKETTKRTYWEGEEGEISWNLFLHSICYFCTLIQNLLLGIVPKQSLILFLQCTTNSSDATTGSAAVFSLRAVMILTWTKWCLSWRNNPQSPMKVGGNPKYCHFHTASILQAQLSLFDTTFA
jgi:hypothetical protein